MSFKTINFKEIALAVKKLESFKDDFPESLERTFGLIGMIIDHSRENKIGYKEAVYDIFSKQRKQYSQIYSPQQIYSIQQIYLEMACSLEREMK